MSAQNSPRRGIFSAIAGLLGFSVLSGLLVTVMVTPALAVTGITASSTIGIFDSLPEYIEIGQQPERNTIYAVSSREGSERGYFPIATIYDQNRQEVTWDEISTFALDATVAGEDRRFFEHGGVDVASVIRASIGNVVSSDIESGASTLSMQLVKNIFVQKALEMPTEEERKAEYEKATATSFDRKLKEMKLAIGLEKKYTKKEILVAYLNIAFFGDNTYGIQAAAQRYYSVDAKDLTLTQAASLIATVQYPTQRGLYDPENYERNEARRDVILLSMLDVGDITQKEYDEAIAVKVSEETLKPSTPQNGCIGANINAQWFCDFVVKNVKNFEFLGATEAERENAWKRGGYKLYTTLDLDVQEAAQNATWTFAPNTETAFSLGSATSTVEAGTGRILVMTENKTFNDTLEGGGPTTSAVNYNTSYDYGGSTGFQSGSTYKVFTLLDWLMHGKGLSERVAGDGRTVNQAQFKDTCADGGGWGGPYPFKNAGGEKGVFDIVNGTVNSVNGVFISMALQLDLCDIRKVAESLGVERGDQEHLITNPSSVLGTNEITPLSLASAYAAIGANGKWCKPIMVDFAVGPDGKDLPGQSPECRQAIDSEVAATATYALRAVVTQGTGSMSYPGDGIPLAGKTGTTDDNNQTWMATFTTRYGTAVWVGNSIDKYNMFNYSAGGTSGAYLRHAITQPTTAALNSKYPGTDFPAPADRLLQGGGLAIPDVRGQTPEQAKQLLEGLGFVFAVGGESDSEVEAGKVAGTDPVAGTSSGRGAQVNIYLSKGNMKQVPDVVGQDFGSASGNLGPDFTANPAQACTVLPPGDPKLDKVVSQAPAGGAYAVPGPVTLTVGKLVCP
ncbi:transglycosylase domain-containing protein [soil metagenome]